MSSTLAPRTRPAEPAHTAALDRAAGVELLGEIHGSGYKEGASLVRRADGQMVQLGPLMYALLESVDGKRTTAELAQLLCERLGRDCDEEHVVALAHKLAAQGLLAGTEENAPPRRNPLLALRWKVLVTNERATRLLTAPFTFLFRPWLVWPVVGCFGVVLWFVLVHKGVASATSDAFRSPGLLLLVFALAVLSAGFHELGHAAACRYGGGRPGGIGAGIYMVWPAFYTDVTDAYRLPRRDRLRVDLGGLYFNAIVSVVTLGVWLAWRRDALLLLVALQLLMMVKNLSPVIRADGYHILADATGVPDLYAHIGPTLRRLLPWRRREPSALTGRARLVVTLWVLVVVPVLLSLLVAAVVLLPHLLATAWDSGRNIAAGIPHESALDVLASLLQLFALFLPVLGSALVTQKLARMVGGKAASWSEGHALRRGMLVAATMLALAGAAWAWWPSGQYRPVQPGDHGTLATFGSLVSAPGPLVHPGAHVTPVRLAPGTHLAVSLIPTGGPTREHPAFFVLTGDNGDAPVVLVTGGAEDSGAGTTTVPAATDTTATTTTAQTSTTSSSPAPVAATAFPFKLPNAPGPGETQALATGRQNGGVTYDVAYALVTIKDGSPVTNRNSAYALASCNACTTVAVSFQVVLVVGRSQVIMPVNVAEALNVSCPACVTTAIADQIVVTLRSQPTQTLVTKIEAALQQLNALPQLGSDGTPAAVAAQVAAVQQQIDDALAQSGQLANPTTTTTTGTTTTTTTTPTTTGTTTGTTTTTTTAATTTGATTTSSSTQTTSTGTTTTAPTTTESTTTGSATTGTDTTTSATTTTG